MSNRFEGKRVILTGAAGDVGRLLSHALCAEGADVVGVDLDVQRGLQLQEELADGAGSFEFRQLDVSDPAAIEAVLGGEDRVDVLIHAAGIILLKPVALTTAEEWDRVQAVNVRAVFLITKVLASALSDDSAIVSISSVGGVKAEAGFGAYSASKAALIQLTKVLARELAPRTRVNVVVPGALDTQMPRQMLEGHPQRDEILAGVALSNPLQRVGQPEEIVPMVLLLASPDASFVTGSAIVMDAGLTA